MSVAHAKVDEPCKEAVQPGKRRSRKPGPKPGARVGRCYRRAMVIDIRTVALEETPLRDAVLAHGADGHRPGALTRAGALLATSDALWRFTFF